MAKVWSSSVEVFSAERLVIITSNYDIMSREWMDYMENNWDELIRKKSSMLLLTGVHGNKDGSIGRVDPELVRDYEAKVCGLKKTKRIAIADNEVSIEVFDLGKFVIEAESGNTIKSKELTRAVKKKEPTIIVIAFCWTRRSVLNRIFRAAGIYAFLVLNDDRARITEGRCLAMDDGQREVIEIIARDNPKNVFLLGGSGTGKTLVLEQALDIKKSYYELKLKKRVEVIVCVFADDAATLMDEMKTRHFAHIDSKEIKFYFLGELLRKCLNLEGHVEDVWKSFKCDLDQYSMPMGALKAILDSLITGSSRDPDVQTILVLDEVDRVIRYDHTGGRSSQGRRVDWSSSGMIPEAAEGLDILMAVSPYTQPMNYALHTVDIVPPPRTQATLPWELGRCHRNSSCIQQLVQFITTHFPSSSGYPTIDDILDQNKLPSGPLPVWILRSKEVEPIQVLEHLKGEGFIEEGERCTVVNTGVDKNGQNGAFAEWCQRNGWKFCPTWRSLIGSEDQVIIQFEPLLHKALGVELMTRARNKFVFVVSQEMGSNASPELVSLLEEACDHGQEEGFVCRKHGQGCGFVGRMLVRREVLGEQKEWFSCQKRSRHLKDLCDDVGLKVGKDFADRLSRTKKVAERLTQYITAKRKNDESATLRHRDWLARVAAGTWERRKDFPVTRDAVDHALEEMEEEDRR